MLPSRSPTVVLIWAMARRKVRTLLSPVPFRGRAVPFGREYSIQVMGGGVRAANQVRKERVLIVCDFFCGLEAGMRSAV